MRPIRLDGLLGKMEPVEGTDALPTPAENGIQLEEHIWAKLEVDYLERNQRENATGYGMGRHGGAQPSGRWAKLTVDFAWKGAGAAYTAGAAGVRPELDVLLRAAGFAAAVDATAGSESVTYAPAQTGHESATFYAYGGGWLYKLVAARGRLTADSNIANQISRGTVEIMALLAGDPEPAALPAITYPRRLVKPPVVRGAAVDLGGFLPSWHSLSLDMGTVLSPRPRGNAADGHAGYGITDFDPTFKLQMDVPQAGFNPWEMEREGTLFPWSLSIPGQQYNRVRKEGFAGQVIKVPTQEKDGLAMIELQVRACHDDQDPAHPPLQFVFD
ncbi:hypothetical protein [Longimicrobium sp.]|uniref:hypothetical protein n=1 Tax=Longimicrobium sp. TaxID=2029185 RepID=UPI002E34E4A7|nr:hypothetical protein [Longimicrobium sp.]HEX6038041.1 hypothetical protein [Longimicrobium sp.]